MCDVGEIQAKIVAAPSVFIEYLTSIYRATMADFSDAARAVA